ncbi:MAG: hypothetical protein U5K72_16455 [Balneolaceae bacterium]|nr:hypothetical protein [Balneolaceae bacterium]
MDKNHSLKNALNEKTSSKENRKTELDEREANPNREMPEPPKEDIVDKLLRGFMAFFLSVFVSAVIAGMLEVALSREISFGSWPMIVATAILYYPFYKILTWMGFFRQK